MIEPIARPAQALSRGSVIALGISIPVSTALDNVLLVLLLAAWALSGQWRDTSKILFKNNGVLFPALLFVLLAFGTLHSEVRLREAAAHLWKYADLLFISLFAIAFRESSTRRNALIGFAIAIALTVLLSYLVRFGMLPKLPFMTSDGISPTVFKLKITHNIFVAFGAFLFLWLGKTTVNRTLRIICYIFAVLSALNVLLLVQGATGYVTLAVLGLLWGMTHLKRGNRILLVSIGIAIATILILIPSPFQQRITLIKQEIALWQSGSPAAADTSTGQRLEYYKNTLAITKDHPVIGVGTGGFPKAYALQVKDTGKQETHNPHNEFLNITVQIGITGLLVLMAMFWTQWRIAGQLATPMEQSLARALVLTLVTGCLVNSLLLDHAEGLFYAWMSGLLYGGLEYPPDKLPAQT